MMNEALVCLTGYAARRSQNSGRPARARRISPCVAPDALLDRQV